MTAEQRYHRKQRKAKQRKIAQKKKQLQQEQAKAQAYLNQLEQALRELGLEESVVKVIRDKLKTHRKLLGKIFAMMFPSFFGCSSYNELFRVRGWDKNLPGIILGALPKAKWIKLLRKLAQDVIELIWKHVQDKSASTKSRWQLTWIADDSLFKKFSGNFRLVSTFWSGQIHAPRLGIDGLLLVVVIGEGKLIIPVDFEIRRPDPPAPGFPCYTKIQWLEVMFERVVKELEGRGLKLEKPMAVTDSWFGASDLLERVDSFDKGILLVEGKSSYVFDLPNGERVKGQQFLDSTTQWPWRQSCQVPGMRYARIHAKSPTFGDVTVTIVEKGKDRFFLLCKATKLASTLLIRAFSRRFWVEWCFRSLKSLLKTESCQMPSEDAYYGHFVLRLVGLIILSYSARKLLKGRVSMEEMIFSIKHHWRFLESESLEFQALSWDLPGETA